MLDADIHGFDVRRFGVLVGSPRGPTETAECLQAALCDQLVVALRPSAKRNGRAELIAKHGRNAAFSGIGVVRWGRHEAVLERHLFA